MTGRHRSVPRRTVVIAAMLTGGCSLFAGGPPAVAQTPLASCSEPSEDTLTAFFGGQDRFAQTFTATGNASVESAQVGVHKTGTPGNWILEILSTGSGVPANTLGTATAPDASVASGPTTVTASFAPPVALIADQEYALAIGRPGSNDVTVRIREGDDCAGRLYEEAGSIPFSEVGGSDLVFTVFGSFQPPPLEPAQANRKVTLDANKNKVKKGKKVTLTGSITEQARAGECQGGQTVELQRKKPSQTSFTTFTQVQTDFQGSFSLKRKVKKTLEYRAQVVETATCTSALSNSEKVKVKKRKK